MAETAGALSHLPPTYPQLTWVHQQVHWAAVHWQLWVGCFSFLFPLSEDLLMTLGICKEHNLEKWGMGI